MIPPCSKLPSACLGPLEIVRCISLQSSPNDAGSAHGSCDGYGGVSDDGDIGG